MFTTIYITAIGAPIGSPTMVGFLRSQGISDFLYGVIMAMPVFGSVIQIFMSYLVESTGKKRMIFFVSGIINRVLLFPMSILPLFISQENEGIIIWLLLVIILFIVASNAIFNLTYYSWICDIVPIEKRGEFLSRRTFFSTITGIAAGLIIGKIMGSSPINEKFFIIFSTVALFSSGDLILFSRIKNIKANTAVKKPKLLDILIKPFKEKHFLKLIIFLTIWYFFSFFGGQFISVYILEHLKADFFTTILIVTISPGIGTLLFIRFIGKIVDKNGNRPVMFICTFIVSMLTFFWSLTVETNYFWIGILITFVSGITWPGFDISSTNLVFKLSPEENKSAYIANYMFFTSAFGMALGSLCGGAFMQKTKYILEDLNINYITGVNLTAFHLLFLITFLGRFMIVLIFAPMIKEDNSTPVPELIKIFIRWVIFSIHVRLYSLIRNLKKIKK